MVTIEITRVGPLRSGPHNKYYYSVVTDYGRRFKKGYLRDMLEADLSWQELVRRVLVESERDGDDGAL